MHTTSRRSRMTPQGRESLAGLARACGMCMACCPG